MLYQNDYTYDNAGQRLTNLISDQNGPVRTETYGYDEINRLTAVNYGDGNTQSYAFDNMGNRLTKVNNGTPEAYTYNNANMLLTRGANAYTNDANGNTLTGGGRTNTWDSQNRLVQCAYNGTTTTNTYASDGLRHRSVVGANTTDYVLDQTMHVRELLNGTVKATYLVGPRGPEYRRDDQAGTIRWYVYDGLGSVVGEVAPDGTLTRSQSFDVYGCVRTSSGTATTKPGSLHIRRLLNGPEGTECRWPVVATRTGTRRWPWLARAGPTDIVPLGDRSPLGSLPALRLGRPRVNAASSCARGRPEAAPAPPDHEPRAA